MERGSLRHCRGHQAERRLLSLRMMPLAFYSVFAAVQELARSKSPAVAAGKRGLIRTVDSEAGRSCLDIDNGVIVRSSCFAASDVRKSFW